MELESREQKLRYGAACKQVLSERGILAYILKECASEYAGLDCKQIEQYIQDTPQIGEDSVEPSRIQGANTEDASLDEGTVKYDIKFTAKAPADDGAEIGLIINIEAQNKYSPGYPLEKRAVFYGSRLITGQYGREFSGAQYGKLKKVYSIWICIDVPQAMENTISKIAFEKTDVIGSATVKRENYDLITLAFVRLAKGVMVDSSSRLLSLLNYTLLNNDKTYDEKRQKLSTDFGIELTPNLEKGMAEMCNLSDGLIERTEERVTKEVTEKVTEKVTREVTNSMRLQTALKMLKERLPLDMVARVSDVSADEVRKIANDNGIAIV